MAGEVEISNSVFSSNQYTDAQTAITQLTPSTGKAIRILGFTVSVSGASTVTILVGGSKGWEFYFAANGGTNTIGGRYPIYTASVGQVVAFTNTGTVNSSVTIWGYEI